MNPVTASHLDLMHLKKALKENKKRLKAIAKLKREDELTHLPRTEY